MSVYSLVTDLCFNLAQDVVVNNPQRNTTLKQIRSRAFEIFLSKRNAPSFGESEDDATMVIVDIVSHIYCSAKAGGGWTDDTYERTKAVMGEVEGLLATDASLISVLKLLFCLADTALPTRQLEVSRYGVGVEALTNRSLMYRTLTRGSALPMFQSEVFELQGFQFGENIDFPPVETFCAIPGTGLNNSQFFTIPTSHQLNSRTGLIEMDKYDHTNGNWIIPNLNLTPELVNGRNISPGVHQDEGYVTPDHDQKLHLGQDHFAWELLDQERSSRVYSWDSIGAVNSTQESSFSFQNKNFRNYLWKSIHAANLPSSLSGGSPPVLLKTITLQELDVALRNLLIGVESTVFHYSPLKKSFVLEQGFHLIESSTQALEEYCKDFITCADLFSELSVATQKTSNPTSANQYGLIYKALCSSIRCYLQCYRGIILKMPPIHSLLETRHWLGRLQTHIQFLSSLVQMKDLSSGGTLLAHLYNQVSVVTRPDLTYILYSILQSCCTIYFGFLERWIFGGVCEDSHKEFFIESCAPQEMSYNRKFWTRSFVLNRLLVPGFVKGLEHDILMCGKSMALLKQCSPDDPICLSVKEEHPPIVYCLKKSDLEATEVQCRLYKARYKTFCQEKFGKSPESCFDEEYFISVREKSLNNIKKKQEKERKLRAERKHAVLIELKKNMEDAEVYKMQEKKSLLEEEMKYVEEANKLHEFNELQKDNERKKLVHFYNVISEASDRRRERAEWKVKRRLLHDRRVDVFRNELKLEGVDSYNVAKSGGSGLEFSDNKYNIATAPEVTNELGSGDFVSNETSCQTQSSDATESSKVNVHASGDEHDSNTVNAQVETEEVDSAVNDERRDWLIALDVAEQARQSAIQYKQKNMFNDYNILTGEEVAYKDKFHAKDSCKNLKSISCEVEDNVEISDDVSLKNINTIINNSFENEVIQDNFTNNKYSDNENAAPTPATGDVFEEPCDEDLKIGIFNNNTTSDKTLENKEESFVSTSDIKSDEIDITTIYENLQKSIKIPLVTQLELVNEAVLRLLFDKHNLLQHLEAIRKYFFLLDGEFGRNLTKSLFTDLQTVPHPSYLLNISRLNSLLRSAVGSSSDEEYTERLSFVINKMPSVFRLIDPTALNCLSLRYRTHWPLNLIITDDAIIKCDGVFTFLIQIQRSSWALEQDIYLLKDKKLLDSPQLRKIQLYRHIMTHFVTTLNNYVTAVVVEESWFHFKGDLQKVTNLNDIYAAHVKYIKMLLFRCLLNKRSKIVQEHLMTLFGIVLRFHESLRAGEWIEDTSSGSYQNTSFPHLSHEFDNFLVHSQFLYSYLKRLVASGYQPYLVQLLTLLSANDFYKSQDDL